MAFLRRDAEKLGMTWEGYCRHFGIVSGKKLRQIKSMEVKSYEELSTWEK